MEDPSQIIEDFEQILKQKCTNSSSYLYSDNKQPNKNAYKPQDVISGVSRQLKAIQLADCTKGGKCVDLIKYRKSCFLSVDKSPVYEAPKNQNINKFETHCVTDTQLIEIVKDAENLVETNKGITQEFETSFCHPHIEKYKDCVNNADAPDHITKKSLLDIIESNIPDTNGETEIITTKNIKIHPNNMIITDFNKDISPSPILNNIGACKTFVVEENIRSPSPLLNFNAAKTSIIPSPLVYNLDTFEKFEKIATPLIGDNIDLQRVKHLINSQILGNELCLHTEIDTNTEQNLSPILKIFDDKFKLENTSSKPIKYNKQMTEIILSENKIRYHNDSLQDEILFSSDEENYFTHKELQDLPFTYALETSISEQSDILEKMYVGFQTASNKSIQVHSESFVKAKSILSDVNENTSKKMLTLTELVEICDGPSKNDINENCLNIHEKNTYLKIQEDAGALYNNQTFESNIESHETDIKANNKKSQTIKQDVARSDDFLLKVVEKRNFEGFMMASNKKIKLSDMALARCKKVFQDVDLGDRFSKTVEGEENLNNKEARPELKNEQTSIDGPNNISKIVPEKDLIQANINDEIIVQEFENIEMSLEDIEHNTNQNEAVLVGFKTASNKNIHISDNALAYTKHIFQDIDLQEVENEKQCSVQKIPATDNYVDDSVKNNLIHPRNSSISFKTASNKKISVSDKAMAKIKNIFQDIDNLDLNVQNLSDICSVTENLPYIKNIEHLNKPPPSNAMVVGFKTANNNKVTTSDETLLKSMNIFNDTDNVNKEESYQTFKTASNEQINVSDESSIKNKNIEDYERIEHFENSRKRMESISRVFGFQTANNKAVKISEEALAKSRKLFHDIEFPDGTPEYNRDHNFQNINNDDTSVLKDVKTIESFKNNVKKDIIGNEETPVFKGFQTANNKKVTVSKEALAKSKRVFQLVDSKPIGNDKISNHNDNAGNTATPVFKRFETASNNKVITSDEAKRLFEDLELIDVISENKLENNFHSANDEKQSKSIQIANNKKVTNFEEANSKIELQDVDVNTKENFTTSKETAIFEGFQTASNKQVKISANALTKSKKLFQDIKDFDTLQTINSLSNNLDMKSYSNLMKDKVMSEEVLIDNLVENSSFKGFQTANNKKVQISELALAKSKRIFQEIDWHLQINRNTDNIEQDKNLKSDLIKNAQENKSNIDYGLKMSDDALNKSKRILVNIDKELPTWKEVTQSRNNSYDKVNLDNIINTEVLYNFEEALCTEDFHNVTPKSKRSGSPILSCPRAKKRKFETPYRSDQIQTIKNVEVNCPEKKANITYFDNYKQNKRYVLNDLLKLETGEKGDIDSYIMSFDIDSLLEFVFFDRRNDLTKTKMNVEELKEIFLESVNKKLVPGGWMNNHLKLILWKLISYEIKFPKSMKLICTARNVMEQLKYRYDRELYNAERPAIRKILEKDDVATKTIVLCVMGIFVDGIEVNRPNNTNNVELLVTDGWYCLRASTDRMLAKLVLDAKIVVGTKIVTNGAELLNCEQGVAPWEDTSSVRLKLSGNSTRRARWDARLGYHSDASILTRLSNVKTDGGKVSKLRVFITRVYPALYVEKFEDGSTVTRSERLEHLHQTKYEAERQLILEKLYEEVEREFSDQESQDSEGVLDSSEKRRCLDSGSQISKLMKRSKDSAEFRSNLTSSQAKLLEDHTTKRRDRILQDIQTKLQKKMEQHGMCRGRNVVKLLKTSVAGIEEKNGEVFVTKGMLSIWKPNESVLELITEGSWIEVMNVVPTAVRYSEIQISAGRQSVFSQTKYKGNERIKPFIQSLKRKCHPIKDLIKNPTAKTEYNEIDTVGLILLIDPSDRNFDANKMQFQNIYLTDADKNMICVNFWGGLKKFGFENILDTGQIVACTNLQKRAGNTRKNMPQYRATEFSHFTKTPKNLNAKEMIEELDKNITGLDRRKFCDECVNLRNNYTVKLQQNIENITPYRFNNIDLVKNKIFIDTPLGVKINKVDEFNLTGLDFESTFKQTDTQELSPKSRTRKRIVNEKIMKLKMYGEPPPLNTIHILNKSKNALSSYKSPLISKSDICNRVSSTEDTPERCTKTVVGKLDDCSPVTSVVNRTYVKSTVNPVKLNFDHVDKKLSDTIDHFADEFDGSPPLSLD